MKQFRAFNAALGLTLVACFIATANAYGEEAGFPVVLPEPTEGKPVNFTSTSGVIKFNFLGATLECLSGASSGKFTSKRLGTITMTAKRCENISIGDCHTQGSEKGVISFANADLHLVATGSGASLGAALVIKLPSTLKIVCSFGGFEWRGSILGNLEVINGKTIKTANLKFVAEGQCELDKEFCLAGGVHKKFRLEVFNGTEFVAMSMERLDSITFEKEVAFDF
jgi:hypothetical protein